MLFPGLITLGEATGAIIDATVYATIGAHQFFDLGGGGMKREVEQFRFVLRGGDAGQCAQLGEAELAAFEGRRYRW